MVAVPTPEFEENLQDLFAEAEKLKAVWQQKRRQLLNDLESWETSLVSDTPGHLPLPQLACFHPDATASPSSILPILEQAEKDRRVVVSTLGPTLQITASEDGDDQPVHLDLGPAFAFDAAEGFTVKAWVYPTAYGAILSRMDEADAYRGFDMLIMPDGRLNVHLIHQWPGNATKITTGSTIPLEQWTQVAVTCQAPGKAANINVFFNGRPVTHSVDSDSLNGSILTDHPLWLGWRGQTPRFAGRLTRIRIWDRPLSQELLAATFEQTLRELVSTTRGQRSSEDQKVIEDLYVNSRSGDLAEPWQKALQQWEAAKQQIPTTMVMKELPRPRPTWVLKRGVYDQPDKSQPVTAGVPALFQTERQPQNRLELAHWIVRPNNPLTARVAVNHFWSRYFGQGLQKTPENFGIQSPPPTHPKLLDWLAVEFIESGWNIKHMQRLIVSSATYRQASAAEPTAFAADPQNRWLARGPRFRLPAESIRDNALAISGLLNLKIGGPSIKPYQPEGLWAELAGGAGEPPYQQATDDDLYRRSLYIYRKRTVPHPTMTTFDGVGRDVCSVSRDRTNTPLQALALLNDITYVEAARHLAGLALAQSTRPTDRLQYAFRRATGRPAEPRELAILETALQKYQQTFSRNPQAAVQYVQVGQSPADSNPNVQELAAYASVCSVILNLDEVITKE